MKENSTPRCCNCTLTEGEKPDPWNYRGCSHAKEEYICRIERAPVMKTPIGRDFSSRNFVSLQQYVEIRS
jgi:hypothetical protein